jgi:hypothetical protein
VHNGGLSLRLAPLLSLHCCPGDIDEVTQKGEQVKASVAQRCCSQPCWQHLGDEVRGIVAVVCAHMMCTVRHRSPQVSHPFLAYIEQPHPWDVTHCAAACSSAARLASSSAALLSSALLSSLSLSAARAASYSASCSARRVRACSCRTREGRRQRSPGWSTQPQVLCTRETNRFPDSLLLLPSQQ